MFKIDSTCMIPIGCPARLATTGLGEARRLFSGFRSPGSRDARRPMLDTTFGIGHTKRSAWQTHDYLTDQGENVSMMKVKKQELKEKFAKL
jgi:hypothetical protein